MSSLSHPQPHVTPASLVGVAAPPLPLATRLRIVIRLFAIQASWNYEVLMGSGIGFCVEPALRLLPGGQGGEAYRAALARQSQYFNAHPYLAAIAVGALARAELEGQPPARIERFRTALCGPLGSVGDRLVWVGLLPTASWFALVLFGLGVGAPGCVLAFLLLFNVAHVALRLWGLERGWRAGLGVAQSLAHPLLREGPTRLARLGTFLSGVAVPLVIARLVGDSLAASAIAVAVALGGAGVLVYLHGRVEGWRIALVVAVAALAFLLVRHA
ncbi:MAG: PTS system mannose/fructose/sorbose family transporter subunit IID [Gemmatimonadaceae bacterium]|jgi:PTS system mannose-specific IID component|nr:PTS system mannose/fructose/sorbose family transporter subunit IID [Gemmatimonadaceae bacterium]